MINSFYVPLVNGETLDDQLKQVLVNAKEKYDIPAISAAFVMPGRNAPLVISIGTTRKNGEELLSSNALFRSGSVTKTFVAALIKSLAISNEISLDDKIGKYLSDYPKWKNITIRQLVNQTSGIFDYCHSKNWWKILIKNKQKIWQSRELVNIAYQHKDYFPAGEAWKYSNTNYILLGMIIEKIKKKSLDSVMSNLINETRLSNTYYSSKQYPVDVRNRLVYGYDNTTNMTELNSLWIQSAGAIISNPADLAIWMHFFLDDEKGGVAGNADFHAVNIKNGKDGSSLNELVYRGGMFRMNTPEGLIWFTPGLMPGYTTMIVYAPCLNIIFSYSASRAPLKGIHQYLILKILHVLKYYETDKKNSAKNLKLPAFCKELMAANHFYFPPIN